MRIDKNKLDRALAEQCKVASDLRQFSFSPSTITRIRHGCEVNPRTAGKLARALGVPVVDLLLEEVGREYNSSPGRDCWGDEILEWEQRHDQRP